MKQVLLIRSEQVPTLLWQDRLNDHYLVARANAAISDS